LSNNYNEDIFLHLEKFNFTKYFEDYHDFQKYEKIIDVNKMHTLQDFTKYSNDFIEKYFENKIKNKEFSYIDRVFIKIQSNLGSDIKSKICDYLLQEKENTLHYQNLVL